MSKKKHLLRIIVLCSTLPILWLGLYLPRFLYETRGDVLISLVPEKVNYVLCLRGEKLLNETFSGIILADDQQLLNLLQDRFKKDDEPLNYRLGIDFKGTFFQFETEFRGSLIQVNLIPLLNSTQFEKHIGQFCSKESVITSIGHAGIIVSPATNQSITKSTLEDFLAEFKKSEPSSYWDEKIHFANDKEVLILRQIVSSKASLLKLNELHVELIDRELLIRGNYTLPESKSKPTLSKIKEQGFHLSIDKLPEQIADSLATFLKEMGLPTGKPTAISMNYYGMELVETPTLYLIPRADLLLYFSDNFSLEQSIDSLALGGSIERRNSKIHYGKQSYYWKQVDQKCIYIGINPYQPMPWDQSSQIHIKGNPDVLTKVDGKGMMRRFLDLIPLYAAGNKLSQKVSLVQITSKEMAPNTYGFQAQFVLKEGEHSVNSVLSFLLESGLSPK